MPYLVLSRISSHAITHSISKALLYVGFSLTLFSCSSPDTTTTDNTTTSTDTLNLYNFSEFMPQQVSVSGYIKNQIT